MRRILLSVVIVLVCVTAANAQAPTFVTTNSEGKEFWVCFMKNFRDKRQQTDRPDPLRMQLFITSPVNANVRIEVEGANVNIPLTVPANTVVPVNMPQGVQLSRYETAERLAVHITADTTISVYGLNNRFQTTDTYLGLPTTVLGKDYRVVNYSKLSPDLLPQLAVIATEDETSVTITPTATTTTGRPAGQAFTVTLRKGDVYVVAARYESIGACDLTGTRVTSNKPIAVFSGHQCAIVPARVDACNHLVEQVPPMSSWGKHFYLGMLRQRSKYTYRVVAADDNTRVFEDNKLVAVLRAGQFHENLNVSRNIQVTADKPILVAQYAQGFKNGDAVGDPMMILVSPTQQFLKEYRFATPINGDWNHYINLVAPTQAISTIRLNGRRLDSSAFVVLGDSRYSLAQVAVPFGTHVIKGEQPFGLYSYGFGFGNDAYDAYGNMAGQSFIELGGFTDTLPPMVDGKDVRDEFDLTIRDDRTFDRGLRRVRVVISTGLDAVIPKIEEGQPQAVVRIRSTGSGSSRIVLEAEDLAGNTTTFTVCHVFDSRSERYEYMLSDGTNAECASEGAWMAGVFLTSQHVWQDATFTSTGNLQGQNDFGSAQGIGGWGGALIGRRMTNDLVLTARLSLTTLGGGALLSPDTTSGVIFDTLNVRYVPYQEGTTVRVTSPMLNLAIAAEWFPDRFFYVMGGLQSSFLLGSAIETQRVVVQPDWVTFPDGSREQTVEPSTLSSLNSVGFAVFGGVGFTYPITFRMSLFLESTYTAWLTSMVAPEEWKISALGANLGLRYRW
jgi:hypothetical protein